MIGQLNPNEIEAFLHHQLVGRIGCHADGLTYVVPVSYAYDGEYVYVHTHEGLKVNMMRKNPSICFETDSMGSMLGWKSVVAWGTFQELTDPAEREHALNRLTKRELPMISSETTHLSAYWPFSPQNLNDIEGIVFRIKLQEKTGRFEKYSPGVTAC